jgi:hypothetical protein
MVYMPLINALCNLTDLIPVKTGVQSDNIGCTFDWRLATSWATKWSEFESRYCQEFSLLHIVHGAHPASYPMGIRGSFPGGKAAGA